MEANQHFCRLRHILVLSDSKITDEHPLCEICNSLVAAPYYVCDLCKYYVHKSCLELPQQINHSFHPRHPLVLRTQSKFYCDSCAKGFHDTVSFKCVQCDFDLDVECALMSNSMTSCLEGQQHCIQHSSHPHLLRLFNKDNEKEIEVECFACKSQRRLVSGGGVYYGCRRCKYFLHKQCMDELPQETLHPVHHHHGLLYLRAKLPRCICSLCEKKESHTLYFECPQCDFQLCVQCGVNEVRRTINYEDHEHLLCFVDEVYTKLYQCNAYNTNCKLPIISNSIEFDVTNSSIFRCLDCDFKLHLLCGPLPSSIKYQCHLHPLILVDLLIEDNSREFYCDACETERNPRIRVYYCDKCEYTAHVHCVKSEIVNIFKGDLRDVKLKTVGEDFWKLPKEIDNARVEEEDLGRSLLTLKDLIDKLPEDELRILNRKIYWDDDYEGEHEVSQRISRLEHGDDNIDEILQFSNFTERQFKVFVKFKFREDFYRPHKKLKINPRDLAFKMVNVQGYSIPLTLASVLKILLYKHGDISWKSKSSQTLKSITYFFLCQVMKTMHSTFVIDITKELLQNWYFYVEFAHDSVGFDVRFLSKPLEDITRAFFFLQLTRLDDVVPIALQEKVSLYKAKLDMCKKFSEGSSKQEFMKEGINKVMQLKWKISGQVLF